MTSLLPVCPPPAIGAPDTVSVNNNDWQTHGSKNVASWNDFGKIVLFTGIQCKDIPRGTLWIHCITCHCLYNCDGPFTSMFTKWTAALVWLGAHAECNTHSIQSWISKLWKVKVETLTLSKKRKRGENTHIIGPSFSQHWNIGLACMDFHYACKIMCNYVW